MDVDKLTLEQLEAAAIKGTELAHVLLDFYNMDTRVFVERYKQPVGTRYLGDRAREFLAIVGERQHDTR